ncbi:MAG: ATP-binding protein [Paludibacteraceae bacterium]|nr:ATP-binding protein [Paludibacteraceae bacterium]
MERIFKRKLYEKLLSWKHEDNGQTALLIEGARRVGKSTIAEEFAKHEYDSYILIDFNKAPKKIKDLFEDLDNIDYIFLTLQAHYGVTLSPRKSVIIFDEVQKCPLARQAIKYLVQDGRYDYIETGSLISIKKNTQDITIPSEEKRVSMYPMDYEEFRWALDDTATVPLLRTFYDKHLPLGAAFRTKMREFRLYMLVGGMPQAVNTYLNTLSLQRVDEVKRNIIQLYEDDFLKIDPTGRISKLFMSIPGQLSRASNRFVPYNAIGSVEEDKLLELIKALEDSKTVTIVYHCDDPNVGMSLTKDNSRYKIFTADTGLFVTLAFWDKDYTENSLYERLLSDKLDANLGYVYENIAAQMLAAAGNNLFYYTFPKDDKHNYEIDFLLSRGNKILPIEVKSSSHKSHASLDAFCKKFSSRIGKRVLLYAKDLSHDEQTQLLPILMAAFL